MSGGSMDYLSYKIEEYADSFVDKEIIDLAKDFAELAHDCEWYLSGDTSKGDYYNSILKFKNKWFNNRNDNLIEIINNSIENLKKELNFMVGNCHQCKECKNFKLDDKSNYGTCKITNNLINNGELSCNNFKP